MNYPFILWILIPCLFKQIAYAQTSNHPEVVLTQTRFEHLTIEDGLSGNTIYSMLTDQKGYMWFSTLNGLDRYDGYKFTNYKHRPHDTTSIAQNELFALFEDSQRDIWVGSTEAGICKFDPKTERFTSYRPDQPKGLYVPAFRAVSAINEDLDGMIWAGSYGGELRRFDKKTGKFVQEIDLLKETRSRPRRYSISCIYKDRSGSLWIGSGLGLHRLNLMPGKNGLTSRISFTHYLHNPTDSNSISGNSSSICEDHAGYLWIGTFGQGLNRFDPKTGKFTHYVNNPADPYSISNNAILQQTISEDSQGNLWIGTLGGINKLNLARTQFTHYQNNPLNLNSLGDNTILSLAIDRVGTLWVGTSKGISKIVAVTKPFKVYVHNPYDAESIGAGKVGSVFEDKDGNLWVGTNSLSRLNKQTGKFIHFTPPLQSSNMSGGVKGMLISRQGTFWVGMGKQLMRFNAKTGKFSRSGIKQLDDVLKNSQAIRALYEDNEGMLWVGGDDGVYTVDSVTQAIRHYAHSPDTPNGLADYQVNVISEDRRGNIWMGHGSVGLTRFHKKTGKFTWFSHNPKDTTSVSSNTVESLYEDPKGFMWIGTVGGDLCRFDPDTEKFKTYTPNRGLSIGAIYSILPDNNNNLWLGTDNGMFCFSLATHTFTRYDSSDGLQSNLFSNAAWKGNDGALYMGGSNGFNAFAPAQIQANQYIPPVVITEFRLFDKPVPGRQEAQTIELSYNQNFFSFEFAALNYTNSHKNQYAYQLVGVDNEWVYPRSRRNVSYTDLPPGDYTFRVKGANNDGVWNEKGISVQVIIHPPWWKTWWAYSLYGFLFIAGLWSFITYHSHALLRENRTLEEKVALRTNQLQESLETLKSTQTQLIQKEKMASLGELTAGIAHEIQNPLNFVNNFSEVSTELVEELKEEVQAGHTDEVLAIADDLTQNLQKINHHGGRASSIVKGMLEHSRTESGEKRPTDLSVLAQEYLQLAYRGFKAKNKGFECQLLTNFDEELGRITVVPQEIQRVLMNLYNNAFYAVSARAKQSNYADYQPTVEVHTQGQSDGSDRRAVVIRVRDNGTGIADSVKAKVFQPFFTTKPTGEGTGLGLSLSYDIITKGYGGTLTVESQEGKGTEFVIELPQLQKSDFQA